MKHAIAALAAAVVLFAAPHAAERSAGQATAQDPQQRPPVFRAGANLVQVDAYPSRDGRIVEGLNASDFQVFEDGRLQAVDGFEFVRIEPNTPVAERLDPNTQEEGNRLAADPRNRVFVVYLDHYHVNITGSHRTRQPLIDMLNRLLTATDLFGVMTPLLRPRDLIFGRKTQTIEEQLTKYWTWGGKGQELYEPDEEMLVACAMSGFDIDLGRRRQEKIFDSLDGLVEYLGAVREARKVLLLFSPGWRSYQPIQRGTLKRPAIPEVGVDLGGRLTTAPVGGRVDASKCNSEMLRLDAFDTDERVRLLLAAANRNNVSFYPVNPLGLETVELMGGDAVSQLNNIRDRGQQLLTLAENTDGLVVSSNDMGAGLRRIADDVSAYYVLSYYSSNAKRDGKYRRIEVKMKPPGLRVKARRGYTAPREETEAERRAAMTPPAGPTPVDEALGILTRLRPAAELFSYAAATARELAVVVELPADRGLTGRWSTGAGVEVTVTDAAGATVGTATGRIEPPARGSLIRIPLPAGSTGPWAVAARVGDGAGSIADRLEVSAAPVGTLVGRPILFRARPPASAPLHPVADYQYRRNERMHVDWSLLGEIDQRAARVLGRNGAPLALPVTVTERELNGQPTLSMDLNLAPLTEADYLIELIVGRGSHTERSLIAFRVIR